MTQEFTNLILNSPYFKQYEYLAIAIKYNDPLIHFNDFIHFLDENDINFDSSTNILTNITTYSSFYLFIRNKCDFTVWNIFRRFNC